MRGDLHMSATEFGFVSGIFFWGYFIFELPSNIIMEKVGARLWIARIMISWGLLAAATAFVTGQQFRGVAVSAGAGGGRVPAGADPVFHLLAVGLPSCAGRSGLSGRTADRGRAA